MMIDHQLATIVSRHQWISKKIRIVINFCNIHLLYNIILEIKKYLFAVNISKKPCSPATLPNHNFPTLTPHHIYDGVHDEGGKHFEQDTASKISQGDVFLYHKP